MLRVLSRTGEKLLADFPALLYLGIEFLAEGFTGDVTNEFVLPADEHASSAKRRDTLA